MADARELRRQLRAAEAAGIAAPIAAAEREADLPAGLLFAIASRESGIRDVVGDGGHRRGVFQLDDRSHAGWLARHGAVARGGKPPVGAAARYAAEIVAANRAYARLQGVREADALRFALAAFDAGPTAALRGYRQGDPDLVTAGGNYAGDVLARLEILQGLLEQPGSAARPVVRPGAHDPAVVPLKDVLGAWFAVHPPSPSLVRDFVYGAGAVEAVRRFQRANALAADGVVGPETWSAVEAFAAAIDPGRRPPLPRRVSFPADEYPRPGGWLGLQPWIAPQVQAVCLAFELRPAEGWGTHPPHAVRSDHRWGGACDLAGDPAALADCARWARSLAADPYEPGAVFRRVGGPGDPGHADHVHLAWYRYGPATTLFDVLEPAAGVRPGARRDRATPEPAPPA